MYFSRALHVSHIIVEMQSRNLRYLVATTIHLIIYIHHAVLYGNINRFLGREPLKKAALTEPTISPEWYQLSPATSTCYWQEIYGTVSFPVLTMKDAHFH